MGYLEDTIKSPTFFSGWDPDTSVYVLEGSIIVIDDRETPTKFKVNLSIGDGEEAGNQIFPEPMAADQLSRDNFTETMKKELNIK